MVDPMARFRMRRGQYDLAAARLRMQLEDDPSDLDKELLLAIAESKRGAYADAKAAFDSARLAETYDLEAIEARADMLRVLGSSGQAALLRTEALCEVASTTTELRVLLDLVDDYRTDGNLHWAHDVATMAIAVAPDRGAPYAQLAEVWMDLGLWDAARSELNLADQVGPRSSYIARANVRLLVHENQLDEAHEIALTASREDDSDLVLRALRAELATAKGDPEEAYRLTHGKLFPDTTHPQMMLAALHAFQAMGRSRDASLVGARFRSIYSRPVLNALGSLEYPPPRP